MIPEFQSARMHLQVLVALALAPTVVALLGMSLVPLVVDRALVDVDEATSRLAVRAVRVTFGIVIACGVIAAWGAAMLLRASIRSAVEAIREATEAISAGDFQHRIESERRDELGALARAIDVMAMRLERLERARRKLLACVSHELRTPLTIVRGTAFSLARTEGDPKRRGSFQLLDEELDRLGGVVEDLVDAASLHAGGVRLHRERADLCEQIAEATARFAHAARERGVQVSYQSCSRRRSAEAHVDVDRVQQVIGNLLANAIRHARGGSTVSVLLRRAAHSGEPHEVDISNVGSEIPEEMHAKIFEPFVQCGERAGRVGLGLAIARDLAEAHGGSLQLLTDGDPERVTFRFRVPSDVQKHRGRHRSHGHETEVAS